jgi:hypothetical protein
MFFALSSAMSARTDCITVALNAASKASPCSAHGGMRFVYHQTPVQQPCAMPSSVPASSAIAGRLTFLANFCRARVQLPNLSLQLILQVIYSCIMRTRLDRKPTRFTIGATTQPASNDFSATTMTTWPPDSWFIAPRQRYGERPPSAIFSHSDRLAFGAMA